MKHCSNCGESLVEGQQFCRSCGAELFAEGRKRRVDRRNLIYIGLFSTLLGALVVLIGGFLGSNTVAFAGAVFALLSFAVMLVGAIMSDKRLRSRKSAILSANAQSGRPTLEKADTTNRLPPIAAEDHFPASVTEQTTTKLKL